MKKENKAMSEKNSKATPTDLSGNAVKEIQAPCGGCCRRVCAIREDEELSLVHQRAALSRLPPAARRPVHANLCGASGKERKVHYAEEEVNNGVLLSLMAGPLMAQEVQGHVAHNQGSDRILREGRSDDNRGVCARRIRPVHRHDAHAFVYVLEGSIVMQVKGGKEVTLTPGQTFYEGP